MTEKKVELKDGPPWGFRVSGGSDTNLPVRITRVNPGSGACQAGVREADIVKEINSEPLLHLTNAQVQHLLSKSTGPTLTLTLSSPSQQRRRGHSASESLNRDDPPPPVWSPPSAPSPSANRKFKPINFNQSSHSQSDGEEKSVHESATLPRYQSPTVTLLQKARQGELPKGAHYLQTTPSPTFDETFSTLQDNEFLKYSSEPETKEKSKKLFIPRKSEPVRGIRFSPGRIEDYDPTKPSYTPCPAQQRPNLKLGSKDLGYESDSTLIIRRREGHETTPPPPPLSPLQQRQVYVEVQKGGEVPLQGLRKPVPPRHSSGSGVKYAESEVNIHYKAPVRFEEKEWIAEDELRRRQEVAMREFYQQQRERKLLQEMEDIQSRRHFDYFTPSQKSPIPLNRYDDEDSKPIPKLYARALFNFLPQNLRELRLRRGDLVTVRRKLDNNWLEGELNGIIGIFPTSYVQVLSSAAVEQGTEGEARVKFNFRGAAAFEMSISQGETVALIRRVDQNWYEGHIGGKRRGIFPVSYVEVLKEPPQHMQIPPLQPQKPKMPWNGLDDDLRIDTRNQPELYRVLYNYFPAHKDELELRENDVVEVLENCDDGWCVGTSSRTGLFGTFPGNYIVPID